MCIAAAIAGAAVVGAGASIYAGDKAASAQKDAASQASGTQLQMYNQTRADQTPWRTSGTQALSALDAYYGLQGLGASGGGGSGTGAPTVGYGSLGMGGRGGGFGPEQRIPTPQGGQGAQSGQVSAADINQRIQNLPGYQFQFDQGNQAVQQNLAARGLLNSGAAGKALTQYGQGYAQSASQDYLNGLRSLAGLGQTSAQATGAAGANAANQIGSNQIYAGNASAAGYANQSNAIQGGLQGLVGAVGYSGYGGGGSGYGPQGGLWNSPSGGGNPLNGGWGPWTTGLN
jgi:hypothetical protein